MHEYFLTGGEIIDGTGAPPFAATLHIREDRISRIGQFDAPAGAPVIDCSGLTIAPGFIDSHTHSDLQVIEGRREKLRQGVSLEIVGNCGFSAYPPAQNPAELREFANGIFCGDDHWAWPSAKAYLDAIAQSRTANVASLVGHGSLRIAVAGNRQGELPESDLARMEALLEEAFDAGATGFSTGLMYAPGSSAPLSELERLCRVAARKGRIYTSHIRSYSDGLLTAIDEQIDLARRTGCRLQISHLQAVGAKNWPLHAQAIDRIERAHDAGIDVEFDCYPYIAGSTVLTQLLPQKFLDGGIHALLARLADPAQRAEIARETSDTIPWRWQDILISSLDSQANQAVIGKTLAAIAEDRDCEPINALLDLLTEEEGKVNMVSFNQSEENLRLSLTHPLSTIISDSFFVKGRPHPRLHGTFPLLLGTMCRERRWLSLPEAIQKITSRPALRYGLADRGVLREGAFADITVFDSTSVDSPANYENPELPPVGIREVFLNGMRVQ
ncbi:MAG: N-acyl-D-amino-acid deacylase family protein [Terriglobales bacterium]